MPPTIFPFLPSLPSHDPFSFLDNLSDTGGPSTFGVPGLPGLDDSEDEDSQHGFGGDDDEEIPNGIPNTSQFTVNCEKDGDEDEEGARERRRRDKDQGVDRRDGRAAGETGREYELRRNINREAFVGSGYTDHDQTGDYDPEKESDEEPGLERVSRRRKRKSDRKRRKEKGKAKARRNRSDADEEGEEDEDDNMRDAIDQGLGNGVAGLDYLDLNGTSQNQEGDEKNDEDISDIDDLGVNSSDIDPEGSRLRKAAKKRMPLKPKTLPKPQSCRSCTTLHLDCSINDDPASYPCFFCQDTRCGCILLTLYTKEQKKGTRIALTKQRDAEKKALREKAKKEAELFREQQKKILDLKKQSRLDKRAKACTECKSADSKCSLEKLGPNDATGGACKRCVKYNRICFVDVGKPMEEPQPEPKSRQALLKGQRPLSMFGSPAFDRRDDEDGAEAVRPSLFNVAPDGEPPKKRVPRKSRRKNSNLSEIAVDEFPGEAFVPPPGFSKKQITTSFCHPFVFNAPLAPKDQEFCLGCDLHTTAFSIFGHPVATPWVVYPDPPTESHPFKYTEIPSTGGHSESTVHSKTNVCKTCTFARQKILFCPGHKLAGIKNLPKPKDFDFDAAYAPLLSDQDLNYRSNDASHTKWCSICPAPAFIECCTKSAHSVVGEKDGCGLMLCEICAVSLLAYPSQGEDGESLAAKSVAALLQDVKKVNIQSRSVGFASQHLVRERQWVPARRELEDVIEEARKAVEEGGGKGGKYLDGVRADVELVSRMGWLWEWMGWEAERKRQEEWRGSGIGASGRAASGAAASAAAVTGEDLR